MTKYLNMRSNYGVETVDELSTEDFETKKAFRAEINRLVSEYHLAGMPVYASSRCAKDWNK